MCSSVECEAFVPAGLVDAEPAKLDGGRAERPFAGGILDLENSAGFLAR
jgi:hypothetical protein